MAFTVEDGSGISSANSYLSVADADTYASDRNFTTWAGLSNAVKQAALIEATLWIDGQFTFLGTRTSASQALAWPRTGVTDISEGVAIANNVVPLAVKRATADLAIKAAVNGETLLKDFARGGMIASEQVGPISISYENGAPAATFYSIQGLFKGLTRPLDPAYAPNIQAPTQSTDAYFSGSQFNAVGFGLSTGG